MERITKETLIKNSGIALEQIYDALDALPEILLESLPPDKTVFFMIDMVNGFAKEGALMSSRIGSLISEIGAISKRCDDLQIKKLAFADNHTELSPEFESYPIHCRVGTAESEIVDELKEIGNYKLIEKNSTNGFLEPEFMDWLKKHEAIDHFILTGDCTDICIQQFANTLKTYFNRQDKKSRVIVPMNLVATYDLGMHQGDLMHVIGLYNMILNGVEVIKKLN